MLIRIISLAILFSALNMEILISDENIQFILPEKKPSVFKKLDIKKEVNKINKEFIFPKVNPNNKNVDDVKKVPVKPLKEKAVKLKDLKKTNKVLISEFIYPKEKPASYKPTAKVQKISTILNKKDFAKAKEIFKLIKAKKWNSAVKQSSKIRDKEFKNLILWMYLKENGNQATFSDYQNFIKKNNNYPRINRLKYLAEQKIIIRNTTPNSIINWFENNPPLGGMGKLKLGEAYLAKNENILAKELIKAGWINANLSKNDLRFYRKKFKNIINSDDHIKRANYLAWNKDYWDLKRMLVYLPKDERALYNARQILMSNSYGVDKSISQVPAHLKNDVGLEYDRLKWRNRRGRLEPSLEILYANGNKTEEELGRADLWWKQRESIARTLIYKKRYKTAYKIASEHSLTSGPEFAEAEWLSGWIALTFLKSGEYAINHFDNFYNNVGYPISLARGAYWLGKSYKSIGDAKNSEKYFREGAVFLTTYYGQLSFNEINYGGDYVLKDNTSIDVEYEKEFNKDPLIKHVILLKELDVSQYSKDILKHLATLNIEKGSEVLAAKLATQIGRYDFAIQISKKASYEKRFYNQFNYPIISTPSQINKKIMPQPEFILSIIRQESEFDRRANSYVGARGMMQLMKYTAKIVAKQAKLPYSISRLTKDPEYNIKLGSYYFNSLLDNYNGVYPFAIAAYNAGPNRVKTWRRVNGDPSKQELDYVDWIELIRFKETRNYVQRVLENVNVYKYMINQKPVKIDNFFK
jgi:soluble lytic murein transglycosylase